MARSYTGFPANVLAGLVLSEEYTPNAVWNGTLAAHRRHLVPGKAFSSMPDHGGLRCSCLSHAMLIPGGITFLWRPPPSRGGS
jgi:hypothetical protein